MPWNLRTVLGGAKSGRNKRSGPTCQRLPELWSEATLEERHNLLVSMLEAVYVDHKDAKAVVAASVRTRGFLATA